MWWLTCQQHAVVVLIVMVNWNGGDALGAQASDHSARPSVLARCGQLNDHVHWLLQHRIHANDALGQRLVAQYGARFVFLASLQQNHQSAGGKEKDHYIYNFNFLSLSLCLAYLFPSLLIKCGYCRLKCKSNSVSVSGIAFVVPIPALPTFPGVPISPEPPITLASGELPCMEPSLELATEVSALPLMGISWLRSVRFELCIFTARESDVVSPGSGVNIDSRVIVNEQSLQRLSRDISFSIYCLIIFFYVRFIMVYYFRPREIP